MKKFKFYLGSHLEGSVKTGQPATKRRESKQERKRGKGKIRRMGWKSPNQNCWLRECT